MENQGDSGTRVLKQARELKFWMTVDKSGPLVVIICLVLLFVVAPLVNAAAGLLGCVALFGAIIVLFSISKRRVPKLKEAMGMEITLPILKEIFELEEYDPNGFIDRNVIAAQELVNTFHDIKGSDYFRGRYRGIPVEFSDVRLERTDSSTSGGETSTTTVMVFNGQWLICDFGKKFAASLRLWEGEGNPELQTESVEFNERFGVFSEDGQAAFYILTPHFMETLLKIDDAADAHTRIGFADGKVHIAMNSHRNSFESDNVKLKDMKGLREKFRQEIGYMTAIIDELMQNEKLFGEGR